MPRQLISTPDATSSPLFGHAIRAGSFVFVSGTTGVDLATGTWAGTSIQEQTGPAWGNCQAILQAADATISIRMTASTAYDVWGPATGSGESRRRPKIHESAEPTAARVNRHGGRR